ncbi:lipocalin family protein [Corynebacterium alimapuense]|uniref:Lipocalin n=1 Tax=Corynebacterium alimapuense TaxID=1576874 RepID=A0A3M8K4K7_9CORY|nr:lipocalin family protein [Corynebacterium alimapuense]RNE48157.1 lipocalin [Corynebacterium alimapuense]
MRRILTALTTVTLAAALTVPVAGAQDIFNGGRLGGGSSQVLEGVSSSQGNPLPEIDGAVDLNKYQGTWYQVAAVPQPFTLQCAYDTRAEYGVIDETTISVLNSCGTLFGQDSVISGTATAVSDASLRVSFSDIPFQNADGPANYRVTYLNDDYTLAIVGDPDRQSGFVLSRSQDLSDQQWSDIRATVESRGWWSCSFLTVPMTEGRDDVAPLCAL